MDRRYTGVDIRCPFYRHETSGEASITCEGFCSGSIVTKTIFRNDLQKRSHIGLYCEKNYEGCPLYRVNEEKYDEHS